MRNLNQIRGYHAWCVRVSFPWVSDYQLYLIPWKFRSNTCHYLTWWICQIGLLNAYYSICLIISYLNRSDMVISFMLHWTGHTIHGACLEAIITSLFRIRGKPWSGTSLVTSLSENIQRINHWMFQFNFGISKWDKSLKFWRYNTWSIEPTIR